MYWLSYYANERFLIYTEASDETGKIDIVLFDREVRSLLNKTIDEVQKQVQQLPLNKTNTNYMSLITYNRTGDERK